MSENTTPSTGQVNTTAAEVYEDFFVPALFGQWSDRLLDTARLATGDALLDVGCGTGIVARAAATRLGGSGAVTGIDVNEGMLAVARRLDDSIQWRSGAAENLPFGDASFDRVVSQFALMFFADRARGVSEMARVARPGGTVTVATWADVHKSPGYAAMVELLNRLFGGAVSSELLAPFTIGSESQLREVVGEVFADVVVTRHEGVARFESLEAWVHTDVRGWTLADLIDDAQYAELLAAAERDLATFVATDGTVSFAAPALFATAQV